MSAIEALKYRYPGTATFKFDHSAALPLMFRLDV